MGRSNSVGERIVIGGLILNNFCLGFWYFDERLKVKKMV